MLYLLHVALVCIAAFPLARLEDIRMPPQIVKGAVSEIVFRNDQQQVKLECVATGTPKPTTVWHKGGVPIGPQSNIMYEPDGIVIKELTTLDEGYYQCIAENMYGTALSNTTHLQRAVLGSYSTAVVKEELLLEEGSPHMIQYSYVRCFPKPSFSWAIAADTIDNSPTVIVPDKRIQIDEDGNLHFSYLKPEDSQNGRLYKCNVLNPHMDLTVGGSYTRMQVVAKGGVTEFAPVKSFSSHAQVIAVVGRNITLRCFFSGYPDPSLTWSKIGGSLPIGRYDVVNHNTELTIRNVKWEDEGGYQCRGSNKMGFSDIVIQIDVQAEPSFASPSHKPQATNVTVGGLVNLTCNADAEPLTQIAWLQNGQPLNPSSLPHRMKIKAGGTQLQIEDVCKNCADGSSDLQVIQCNASNVHGYVFIDAYINVLEKTLISVPPKDLDLPHDATTAQFHCSAESDDSTPITLSWYRVSDNMRLANRTGRMNVAVSADSKTLTLTVAANATEEWRNKWRGQYSCNATNGYSEASAVVKLTVEDPPTLPPYEGDFTTEGAVVAAATASLADMWWIWLIIALILLLLILIICCCFCCRRCKGDTYYVDKKEKRDHKDPEKELADSALQPYRRPDADPLKGSRASLGSSLKGESDEEGSLNEYGDIDAGKFTEDGSFIGDYNTADTRKAPGRSGQSFA